MSSIFPLIYFQSLLHTTACHVHVLVVFGDVPHVLLSSPSGLGEPQILGS